MQIMHKISNESRLNVLFEDIHTKFFFFLMKLNSSPRYLMTDGLLVWMGCYTPHYAGAKYCFVLMTSKC